MKLGAPCQPICGNLSMCPGDVSRPPHGPRKNTTTEDFAATKPFFRGDETILKRRAFNKGTETAHFGVRMISMFELATAFIALFSASIFLAHAVEAYRAQ
jgi:hypothetical protein